MGDRMMKALVLTAALTIPVLVASSVGTTKAAGFKNPVAKPVPIKTGYVETHGVNYYYEIRGKGEPLLLLHGGLGSIDMFAPVMPMLAATRQVIAVDLQGHGRTALGGRSISLIDSLGGGVAFRLAVQHPQRVRKLVLVSTPFAQSGFYPEMLPQQAQVSAAMADMMKETPMYLSYAAVAPHPEDFPRLLDRMGEYMRKPYDWSEDVKRLKIPVMLIYGDSDMIQLTHSVAFYRLLGGGLMDAGWQREHMSTNRLAVLPNLTHYEIFSSPVMAQAAVSFLNSLNNTKTWADQIRRSK
jgi:pimeloyl-ACP methyl ester carboxylesterase